MPNGFLENGSYSFGINDKRIKPIISYINSYCRGFIKIGFDSKNIYCIADFKDNVGVDRMKEMNRTGYSGIWLMNAIYEKEPIYENLVKRAVMKFNNYLNSDALKDFVEADKMLPGNVNTVYDIIRIGAITGDFAMSAKYMEKYKDILPMDDEVLKNIIHVLEELEEI